jgi:cyclic pyranopterin phosphate synthase
MPDRKELPKHFCPVPFTQLFFYATGEVFPCCESGYKVGDLRESTIEELWNGEELQSLREEFLTGKIKTCAKQIKYKRCHLANESLLAVTVPAKVQSAPVRAFDLILNGRCNLECVMCPVWTLPNQVYDSSSFWREGDEKIFPQLERISVKSGEPFIQKDTYRLIDRVSAVNSGCIWTLTTNGQYKLTQAILKSLDKIEIDSLKISIDSLDSEVYASIRLRGDLAKTLATLDGFVEYRKRRALAGRPFRLGVNMAVQKSNWREPPALARYCRDKGIEPIFLYVYDPVSVSISSLPGAEKVKILEHYFDYLGGESQYVTKFSTLVLPMLDELASEERADFTLRWKQLTLASVFSERSATKPRGGSRAPETARRTTPLGAHPEVR